MQDLFPEQRDFSTFVVNGCVAHKCVVQFASIPFVSHSTTTILLTSSIKLNSLSCFGITAIWNKKINKSVILLMFIKWLSIKGCVMFKVFFTQNPFYCVTFSSISERLQTYNIYLMKILQKYNLSQSFYLNIRKQEKLDLFLSTESFFLFLVKLN